MKTTGLWLEGDNLIERRSFDAEPILEQCKTLRSMGVKEGALGYHAADYPPGFMEHYCKVKGISFHELMANQEHIRNMLNDPDLAGFRVWGGRV